MFSKGDGETPAPIKQPTLADLIKEQAKDYLSETEMVAAIEQLPIAAKQFSLPGEIAELFATSLETAKNFHGLRGLQEIGKWLQENNKDYFARVVWRVEEYQGYSDSIAALVSLSRSELPKTITKTRNVISGYEPIWDAPTFWRIGIVLEAQYPNIPNFKLNILYLFSKLDIRILYSIDAVWIGPGGVERQTEFGSWKALQIRLRELKANLEVLNPIFLDFISHVTEKIRQVAGVQKEQSGDVNESSGLNSIQGKL